MFLLVTYFLTLCVSLALLVVGSHFLVRVGTNLSKDFRLSEAFVGVTFLSWVTSLPEVVVSLGASSRGFSDAAMGNLMGSNICNAFLIVGIAALLTPLEKRFTVKDLFVWQYMVVVGGTLLFTGWFYQAGITWWVLVKWQAYVLLGIYGIYFALGCWKALKEKKEQEIFQEGPQITTRFILEYLGYSTLGILLVWGGGHYTVQTVESLSKIMSSQYGYDSAEKIVGLTVLSLGTSLPELVTSAIAAYQGKTAMSLANVFGSNMFNKFGILPVSGLISPIIFRDAYLIIYTIISDVVVPILCLLFYGKRFFTQILGLSLFMLYAVYLMQVAG